MRLAVLSDIHGNLIALDAALDDLKAQGGADVVWVLGDLAAFGPRPQECVQRLRALPDTFGKDNVRFIHGNTDRYVATGVRGRNAPAEDEAALQRMADEFPPRDHTLNWTLSQLPFDDYRFLATLPGELSLDAPGYGGIVGYHGVPGDDEGFLRPSTPDEEARDQLLDREGRLGIGGHIHEQMDRDLGSWRVLNVGSVGMSFERPGTAQYALLTVDNGAVDVDLRNVPYDVNSLIIDMRTCRHPQADWALSKFRLK